MQIKFNCVYLFSFLLSFLLPFSLLANENPMEYRGVKLGMSIDEISSLESVKTGYMPNLKKLLCLKGEHSYDKLEDKVYLNTAGAIDSKISIKNDDIIICKNPKNKNLTLKGKANISYSDTEFWFYKYKLYSMVINYQKSKNLKVSLDNLLKRYKNENFRSFIFDPEVMSKNKKYKIMEQHYGFASKLNQSYRLAIVSRYYKENTWIKPKTEHQSIFVWFWDDKKSENLKKIGRQLLQDKIKNYKKKAKEKKLKVMKQNEINKKLRKKYDY